MADVLGSAFAKTASQRGSDSDGQANPERKRAGSEVNSSTWMAISRVRNSERTARPRKTTASRNGVTNRNSRSASARCGNPNSL